MTHDGRRPAELELKFSLDGRAVRALERHRLFAGRDHHRRTQRTIYFDTAAQTLRASGLSLRVRQVGDAHVQTLKTRGAQAGLFDRGEWEMPVAGMTPDLAALSRTPAKNLKPRDGYLVPLVRSDVERTAWLVDHLDSAIEVVLDSGAVSADRREMPFHELELELKHGDPAALFSVARTLLETVPLRLGVLSKQERGEMLADEIGGAHKAARLTVDRDMSVEQVFGQVLSSTLRQFRLNEDAIVAEGDPEALHQARIAMRRLRGALTLFRPAIRQPGLQHLRDELRWFTGSLADARDLDVFLADHDDLARSDRRTLHAARRAAYADVCGAIDSQRLRTLLLDLVEWLSIGPWQKAAAAAPIAKFAGKRLDALWKKVRRQASDLEDLDDKSLHRLRIDAKKLRYAVEFLETLYGKDARKFTAALERIQDGLGEMNDAAIGRQLIVSLALRADADVVFAVSRAKQLRKLAKQFKKLRKVGRFWG